MNVNEQQALGGTVVTEGQQKVTMPRSEQFTMQGRETNQEYQIFVAVPEEAPPAEGFPVVYMLDANSVFGTFAEAVRLQSRAPDKTGVVPAVVVGIGYVTEQPFHSARHYDYTLPVTREELPFEPPGGIFPPHGGAEQFLNFIEEQLKPRIERDYRINRLRQTLFGHSLGGLFVLLTLFSRPESFQSYVAGSPSIHWNLKQLEEVERKFADRVAHTPVQVDVYIGLGELERAHKTGMFGLAGKMFEALQSYSSYGVRSTYKEFEGEGHVSVLPGLINRTLRFALSP